MTSRFMCSPWSPTDLDCWSCGACTDRGWELIKLRKPVEKFRHQAVGKQGREAEDALTVRVNGHRWPLG